jgi:IS6 family transposase
MHYHICLPYTRINTDKYPCYIKAISDLQKEDIVPKETKHTQIKYLNNRIESDHFRLKKHMKLIHSFQNFYSASRAIKGMESMLMIKKKQCIFMEDKEISGEVKFIRYLSI